MANVWTEEINSQCSDSKPCPTPNLKGCFFSLSIWHSWDISGAGSSAWLPSGDKGRTQSRTRWNISNQIMEMSSVQENPRCVACAYTCTEMELGHARKAMAHLFGTTGCAVRTVPTANTSCICTSESSTVNWSNVQMWTTDCCKTKSTLCKFQPCTFSLYELSPKNWS